MRKNLLLVFSVFILGFSLESNAQISFDPSVTNIQVSPSSGCLDSNNVVTVTIQNLGPVALDLSIDSLELQLKVTGPDGINWYKKTLTSGSLAPSGGNSINTVFTNINLYDGGCYSINADSVNISDTPNMNSSNDSLPSPLIICNSRPINVDYTICEGSSIQNGQGLRVNNCMLIDSVLIPFGGVFNTLANPSGCSPMGASQFSSATLPTLPPGANILSGELGVTNLQLNSFPSSPASSVRFSLFQGSTPATAPNIYHYGLIGSTSSLSSFDYKSAPSKADLNSIYVSNVPVNPYLNMGYWSVSNCTSPIISANAGGTSNIYLKIIYEYPGPVKWFEQASGGVSISSSSVFDPLSTPNSVITNSNTTGTYTFYGACPVDTNCRVAADLVVASSPQVTASVTNVLCKGDTTGVAVISSTGGTGPITTNISPYIGYQAPSGTFGALPPGVYTATGVDVNFCIASTVFTISEPATAVQITNVTSTVPSCVPGCDATMTVTASGGTAGYLYSNAVLPAQPSNIFVNQCGGTSTISVIDANGCIATSTATITTPSAPIITNVIADNVSCNGGSDGSIQILSIGGSGGISYTLNPFGLPNATGNFTNLPAGAYSVSATDANGCTVHSAVNVYEPPAIQITNITVVSPSCNPGNDGSVTITASGGTGILAYNSNSFGPVLQASNVFNGLSSGVYFFSVTDANGCKVDTAVTVTSAYPSFTNITSSPSICGQPNGSISTAAGGSFPLTYSILQPINFSQSNATGNFLNLPAGTYTVQVTNTNNCSETSNVVIQNQSSLNFGNVIVNNVNCNGGTDGSINVQAPSAGNYSFSINPLATFSSPGNFTNLASGSYTVRISDSNNCYGDTIITISEPAPLQITNNQKNNVDCFGDSTGSISVTATGGTGYLNYSLGPININNVTGIFSNLPAGSYEVTVTDINNCTVATQITITEPPQLTFSASTRPASCATAADGAVTVFAQGGTGNYSYIYNNNSNANSPTITNLIAGTYFVEVIDSLGCKADNNITIAADFIELRIAARINESCEPGGDGILAVYGFPSDTNYVYSIDSTNWQKGEFKNLAYGDYQSFAVDTITGCTASRMDSIRFNNNLPLNQVVISNEKCFGQNNGSIVGPNKNHTYSIIPNAGNNAAAGIISDIPPGIYTLIGEQANGCKGEKVIEISAADSLWIAYTLTGASNVHCYGSARFELAGGTGQYTYSINPSTGRVNSPGFYEGLCWGDYTLSAKDNQGCIVNKKISIGEDLSAPKNMFHHFKVYPNPASNEVWLQSDYLFQYEVSIINATGQNLMQKNFHDRLVKLDVGNLSPGIYLLRFESDVDFYERKIVIQH